MSEHRVVICLSNAGYEAALEPRKLYALLADAAAEKRGHVRIVDESGDDYLYPATLFLDAQLSDAVAAQVARAA